MYTAHVLLLIKRTTLIKGAKSVCGAFTGTVPSVYIRDKPCFSEVILHPEHLAEGHGLKKTITSVSVCPEQAENGLPSPTTGNEASVFKEMHQSISK